MSRNNISILGAGLVGAMLGSYLAKKGHQVAIFEKRKDPRKAGAEGGRSINLALSNRGLKALHQVGVGEQIKELLIPMQGRMMHDVSGQLTFQPYGKEGQYINSVSRAKLNEILVNQAEANGVQVHFGMRCESVDWTQTRANFIDTQGGRHSVQSDLLFGADGAFSALRSAFMLTDRFNYQQHYIEHGYKELCMPPTASGDFAMEPNYLHIWTRGNFMLIALPNPDKTFTCTLFFPFDGATSFATLNTDEKVMDFFRQTFPDVVELIPNLLDDYKQNPTSSLVTVKCAPWVKGNCALIGDAAHAIVPFYGQGMNAGFEDCYVLNQIMEAENDWPTILAKYASLRKPDGDAIADLALKNFIEMRDKVGDPQFLLQKKIEAKLHELYPSQWIPLYSMVTFSEIRYSDALAIGKRQEAIMEQVMAQKELESTWQNLDFEAIVSKLDAAN
jgi:kynurenine 3-monooxygenase